jgi:hypothetical protein
MAESKHLGAELGVGAGADQDEVDHEEDKLVGKAEKHARGTRPAAMTICGRRPVASSEVYPWQPSEVPNRTDVSWCTAQASLEPIKVF